MKKSEIDRIINNRELNNRSTVIGQYTYDVEIYPYWVNNVYHYDLDIKRCKTEDVGRCKTDDDGRPLIGDDGNFLGYWERMHLLS